MWHVLPGIARRFGATVRPVPVLFAGLLKAHGQLGPAEIAAKLEWMNRNVLRKTIALNIPFNTPVQHPFRPLLLLRLAAAQMTEKERFRITDLLFRGVWVDRLDPNDTVAIQNYLEANDFPARELLAQVEHKTVKQKVKANTDECIAKGGFGVPTVLVDKELFWGFDDLPYLESYLAGEDPLNYVDVDAFIDAWNASRIRGAHRQR